MLIVDGHLDLAMNALQGQRDLALSAYTLRAQEHSQAGPGRAAGTVAFPEMRRGRVALSFATLIARSTGTPAPFIDFASPAQAHAVARGHLAYYRALERLGQVRVITGLPGLERHLAEWQAWDAQAPEGAGDTPPLGLVISMESADPILAPEDLEDWHRAGLRLIGPTHYGAGRYAGGTGVEAGLTDLGRGLLREMERLGVPLDVSHLSDQAFWEALEVFGGPVLASHNNCRALVPHQRQLSDDQLRALIGRGAVIGAVLDAWMLIPGWRVGDSNRALTLAAVADHLDHVCQLAGDAAHAALGSDLDGGFGREECPSDFDTIADLQIIGRRLAERGYSAADVAAVMHGNWLRFLTRAWGGRP